MLIHHRDVTNRSALIRRIATLGVLMTALLIALPATARADGLPPMMLHQRPPAGAIEIADAMRTAKAGEAIVVRGRISDGSDVFVSNRAILRLADEASLPACCAPGAASSGGTCTVPANRRATVQFLDTRGRLIRLGLNGMHGLSIGKEVFIVGTVLQADNDRTLIINATAMHVPVGDMPIGIMVNEPPAEAVDVADAKSVAKVGDEVVVRGRVGGAASPFGDGRATMTIFGAALAACPTSGDDACATPWDCCRAGPGAIASSTATIEVVDASGEPIRTDLRGRRSLEPLSEVTVKGTVTSTQAGAFVIRAGAIHVASNGADRAPVNRE